MATLRDISEQLNISQAVVSRVLNGRSDVRVSDENRRRIIDTAAEFNYRPSASARALATGRTMQIGVLAEMSHTNGGEAASSPSLHGLLDAAAGSGYRVVLQPLSAGSAGERQVEDLVRDRACDGICVFSSQLASMNLDFVTGNKVPLVVIGETGLSKGGESLAGAMVRVDHDNYRHAFDSVLFLHAHGHRNIAWCMTSNEGDQPHNLELRRGFHDAMRQIGSDPVVLPAIGGEGDIRELIHSRRFSAVIVRYLHGVISWLHHSRLCGLNLPDDLTILGHMDVVARETLTLTGMRRKVALHCFDAHGVGQTAGRILVEWAQGRAPEETVVLVPSLAPGFRGSESREVS